MRSSSGYGAGLKLFAFVSLIAALLSGVIGIRPTIAVTPNVSPSEMTAYDYFGDSCAMSGDYLIVGARGAPFVTSSSTDTGAAYIYSRTSHQKTHRIESSTSASKAEFGSSVAISGETAVVGAPNNGVFVNQIVSQCGTAFVYTHMQGTTSWPLVTSLRDPNPRRGQLFGYSVAIDGNTIVVGAPGLDDASGTAHVFHMIGGVWEVQAVLSESSAIHFGHSVDVEGDIIVVGAPVLADSDISGRVFVYVRSGTSWSRQATLHGEAWYNDAFGMSVAISGDIIVVGAPYHGKTNNFDKTGSAFIFERTGSKWTRTALLRADYGVGIWFGYSVAIEGVTVVVGAPRYSSGLSRAGRAYTFGKTGSDWVSMDLLTGHSSSYDELGRAVCIHKDTIVAGSELANNNVGYDSGEITFFASLCAVKRDGTYMIPFVDCEVPADPGYHVPNDGELWDTQVPCNGGTWQNLAGQTTCNKCPGDTVTPTPGAFTSEADCKAPFPASVTLGRTTALTTFAAPDSATMDGDPCRVVSGTKVGERSLIVPVVSTMYPGRHTIRATFNADLGIQGRVYIYIPSGATYSAPTAYTLNGKDVTFQTKYPVCLAFTPTLTSGSAAALVDVARDGDMPVCVHRATMPVDDIIAQFTPGLSTARPEGRICIEYGADNTDFTTIDGIDVYINGTQIDRTSYRVIDGRVCSVTPDPISSDSVFVDVVLAVWEVRVTLYGTTVADEIVYDIDSQFSPALFVERVEHWTVVAFIVAFIIAAPSLPCTLLITVLFFVTLPCVTVVSCAYSLKISFVSVFNHDKGNKDPDDPVMDAIASFIVGVGFSLVYDAFFRTCYAAVVILALVNLVPLCWLGILLLFVVVIAMFVCIIVFGFLYAFYMTLRNMSRIRHIRAQRRAIKALTDDVYTRASKINARMERHPHLQPVLIETDIPDTDDLADITVHLASLYCYRFDAVKFEEKLGIKTKKDVHALRIMAAHCKKLMDAHPLVSHKVEAATGNVQKVGLSPFRRDIFSMTDANTPVGAVQRMKVFNKKDTSQYILHPMATPFIVHDTNKYTKLDTVKRANVVANRAECFEVTGDFNPQEEWAALMQVIGKHAQVMPVFDRTNLAHIVRTWAVVAKLAAVDQDELIPRAAKAWTKDVKRVLQTKSNWKLDSRPQFSAHVAALKSLVGHVQLFAGENLLDEVVVAQLRIAATAAVQDEALLLSMPADHEEEMDRIKKAIKRGKRAIYHAENPESDEETEDPAVVRAQLRQLGREREQLMAGLAHLNGAGFVNAPVLPPLENRCEDTMTLAMFENVCQLAQSNATILAARYNGEAVVLKQYSGGDKKARKKMYNELRTLEAIRHPNVAQIKYAFPDQRMFYLVFDHYKYGDLLDWANDTDPTEGDVLYAAKKTIEAVACLHDHDIIHCDIKPANVFVTATGNPMLGDFDVSKSADGRTMTATVAGSLAYMAPELYTKSDTGEQPRMSAVTDVFSLGRTLSQLVAGRTDLLDGVIKRMTAEKPSDRPTLVEVLQDAAFTHAERGRVAGIVGQLADLKKRQDELARKEKTMSAQVKQVTDDMWARHEELAAEARRIEHLKEERLCMICKERLAVHAYSKCGHVSVCAVCAQPKRCPRCNKKSTKVCYAFKGALSKVSTLSFAMMDTAERSEVVRAVVLEYGMVDTVMTLYELLNDYPRLPFHKMDDELMLETLRHMKARGMAVLIQCGDGMGVKFPYGSL